MGRSSSKRSSHGHRERDNNRHHRERDNDHHDNDNNDRHRRGQEVDEEERREDRLLRKAKEYIQAKEKQQQQPDRKDHHKEDERKRESRKEEGRSSHRHRRHDDDEKGSDKDYGRHHHSSSRQEGKRHRDDEEDNDQRKRSKKSSSNNNNKRNKKDRKSDKSKKSSRKHHKKDNDDDKKKSSNKEADKEIDKKQQQSTISRSIPDKKFLVPLGERLGHAPDILLNATTNYFSHHQHLWLYLFREEGLAFNDITSSNETHDAFERFVQRYNAGDLEIAYYSNDGALPAAAIDECKTTRHSWSFRITDTEDQTLHSIEKGVRQETESKAPATAAATSRPSVDTRKPPPPPTSDRGRTQQQQQQPLTSKEWVDTRVANRRLREHAKTVAEELSGGKKDGHERIVEKKRELSSKIHGASRDARDHQAVVELTDDAIYGDGDSGSGGTFQQALAKERQRQAARMEKQNTRIEQLQIKEKEKQEAMLKMLGLDNIKTGQKITIAPRNDG